MTISARPEPSQPGATPATMDRGLWSAFAGARSETGRLAAWLALLVARCRGATLGVVLERNLEEGVFQPVAVVPDPRRDLSAFAPTAERVLSSGRPAVPVVEGGRHVGYPVLIGPDAGPQVAAVIVLDMPGADEAAAQAALQEVHWASGWIAARLADERATDAAQRLKRAEIALDILAVTAEHAKPEAAAMAILAEAQAALAADQASIGMVRGRASSPRIRLLALSHAAWFRRRSSLAETLETAMEECFDQVAPVAVPALTATARAIAVAHADHVKGSRTRHILTVPLSDASGPVGAMTFERREDKPFGDEDLSLAEAIAALVGPALELKRRNRRWIGGRLVDGTLHVLGILLGPRRLSWKLLALVLAGLVAGALTVTGPFRVQADAVLRGEINRAVVAPFAGFIAEAPLRAGDTVSAGDILVRLDQADLQLEALRWRSEMDRLASQSRDALAQKDRAQVALLEAQVAQARAQADLAEAQLARAELRAPIDGVIVSGDLSQKLGAPVQLGEVLFEVAPLDRYRVDIFVDERDLRYVTEGTPGRLALAGQPSQGLPLAVTRITPMAEARNGANTFRVEAALDAVASGLRPGMQGVAKLDAGQALVSWVWSRRLIDWARETLWTWQP
ncbi:efflux RND transporter periplasmic adaptor subunit [Thetidibacter halocola]|uniref:Efflux RND transporter periplasmic adaptor subunit n=1 Tax=Thetidibacter halocola TaxID=2827239 RepID=A0A8J7WCJ6_9RHOB|nr:efflux RND transporter periplasmic adaptor subunit [Thetidibacter halocola]MBS0122653.1 efflux RND transporter periplasmic adaptor subunit [Thetidibacter halocola]